MAAKMMLVVALMALGGVTAERRTMAMMQSAANPVRKVVTMLQQMQKKVEEEGKMEKELHEKFMCYCSNSGGDLKTGIEAAEDKVPQLESDIKEADEQTAQLKDELKEDQGDRATAKAAVKEATAIRSKEAKAFAAMKAEADANIKALTKAQAAIEKGAGSSFLQTTDAKVLKKLAANTDFQDSDRQELTAFLSSGSNAPSDAIIGVLKQMGDTMNKDLSEATADETTAISKFEELMAVKGKEVDSLTNAVESKIKRIGDLGVKTVEMKEDLDDTAKGMEEDKLFLKDLASTCKTKAADWEIRVKTRNEELAALADTIKILNDDDALELFKKTLPGSAASFVQVQVTSKAMKAQAMAELRAAKSKKFDFILLALHGKSTGFDKVLKMVDAMTALLKEEQVDDDNKKEVCEKQLDEAEDKQKGLDRKLSDAQAAIASSEEGIATMTEEMKALSAGIIGLDKSVGEATAQRQQENTEYKELMSSNTAAKQIMDFAKNRLNKFYNPSLYKAPAEIQEDQEDSFVQVAMQTKDSAPPAPPPGVTGAYKKSGKSTGVIAMIDLLVGELDKEMTEAKQEEKDSQADYEAMMKDSAEKRTLDAKAITEKEAAKADMEAQIETSTKQRKGVLKELYALGEYVKSLHDECDWLLQNYDARKQARVGEIDSLDKAKAILSGSDDSFVQLSTKARRVIRRVM